MSPEISERSFGEAIEWGLLQDSPDACTGDATAVRDRRVFASIVITKLRSLQENQRR